MRSAIRGMIATSALVLASCGADLSDINGTYTGTLTVTRSGGESVITNITADVTSKLTKLNINISDSASGKDLHTVHVSQSGSSGGGGGSSGGGFLDPDHDYDGGGNSGGGIGRTRDIKVKTAMFPGYNEVRLEVHGGCAENTDTPSIELETCFAQQAIQLDFRDLTSGLEIKLLANKGRGIDGSGTPISERPTIDGGEVGLERAIALAKKNNLDTLMAAQDVYRAREEMLVARGALLPSLNLGTLLSIGEGPFALLSQSGNLLPFIFPNNWYRAGASEATYEAERLSFAALKANQMNAVHSLYYMVLKDEAYVRLTKRHLSNTKRLSRRVSKLVELGQAPGTWKKVVRNRIILDEQDLLALEDYLHAQKIRLVRVMGAMPSENEIDLVDVKRPRLSLTGLSDISRDENTARNNSPELKEMIQLESAARRNVKAGRWSWVNPGSDSRFNIGFSRAHALNVEQSNVQTLALKRESIETEIRSQLLSMDNSLGSLKKRYRLAREGARNARDTVKGQLAQLEAGLDDVTPFDIMDLIDQEFEFEVQKSAINYGYLVTMSKYDRLLFKGIYAGMNRPGAREPTN